MYTSSSTLRARLTPGLWRRAVATALATLLVSGCAVQGLSFVQDTRVQVIAPRPNETVRLPFAVRWSAADVDGSFAVFFSRSPIRPGQTLRSLVPENDPCRREPRCPDAAWLADRDVYIVDGTSLRVERLPDRRNTNRASDRHDVTIVLLDSEGRRVGESAFTREFIVHRES